MTSQRDLLITGGRVIDPANGIDGQFDVLVRNGRIEALSSALTAPDGARRFDASGLVVAPGLVDPHCHLRTPGQEHKESIESGARAAAAGGYTSVVAMANTDPVVDNPAVLREIGERAADADVHIYQLATISIGMAGSELVDMGRLAQAGAVGFSDDGIPLASARLMRTAFEYARRFDLPVANHAEDPSLIAGASMHEGLVSARLGLTGAPREAEEIMLDRDLRLAILTGARYHALHISSGRSPGIIARAKSAGADAFAEVSPHHLTLTDELVAGGGDPARTFDSLAKVNPPLRTQTDIDGLRAALGAGVFDIVGTDHAPHAEHEKLVPFEEAAPGFSGFETALPLMLGLVSEGVITLPRLLTMMTITPALLYGLDAGTLSAGAPADIVAFDPDSHWVLDRHQLISRGKNTPLDGKKLKGRTVGTWVGGRRVYEHRRAKRANAHAG